MTLPVVVTKSMFQETPLLFIGMAPPAFERNAAARRMSCMSSKGASLMSHRRLSDRRGRC